MNLSTTTGTSSLNTTKIMKRTLVMSNAPIRSSGTGSRKSHFWNEMFAGNVSGGGVASKEMSRPISCVDGGSRSYASSSHILQGSVSVSGCRCFDILDAIDSPCTTAYICDLDIVSRGGNSWVDEVAKVLDPMMMHQIETLRSNAQSAHGFVGKHFTVAKSTNRLLSRRSRVKT